MNCADPVVKKLPSKSILRSDLEALRNLRVEHPAWVGALAEVEDLIEFSQTRHEGSGLMIVGESGAGKTSLLRSIEAGMPRSEEAYRTLVPCLYARVPPRPTIKATAQAILAALGDPICKVLSRTTEELSNQVVTLLHGCETRIVLLDEMNHLVEGRRSDRLESVADWIKDLVDRSRVPFVLAGLPSATAVRDANDQLRRRIAAPFELSVVGKDPSSGRLHLSGLQSILKTIGEQVPVLRATDLSAADMARRLYFATDGRLGYVMPLLDATVRLLHREDRVAADPQLLARAFRQTIWRTPKPGLNPFDDDFSWRRLDRVGEPFMDGQCVAPKRKVA